MPELEKREEVVAKENSTSGEQSKEQKTKRELEAMARQRLGCAVPVRRDVKGGWYFQVIEVIGFNPAHFNDGQICSPKSWDTSMT